MRNLKKFLALVLAMMMAFSLMVTANAANEADNGTNQYNDTNTISADFVEAVDVLYGMGIMTGDYGSFKGNQPIMRSEMTAVLYRLMTGDTTNLKDNLYADIAAERFADVNATDWFAPYVGWCYDAGLVKGSNGYFRPWSNVTGYETLVMVLRAMGYGKNSEYIGVNWKINASTDGTQVGLLKDVNNSHYANTLSQDTRRDVVASIVFQAAQLPVVTWSPSLGYNKYVGVAVGTGGNILNPSLGYTNFGLTSHYGIVVGNQSTGEAYTKIGFSVNPTITSTLNAAGTAVSTLNSAAITDVIDDAAYSYLNDTTGAENVTLSFDWTTDLRLFGHAVKVWYDYRSTDRSVSTIGLSGGNNVGTVSFDDHLRTYALYDKATATNVIRATNVDLTDNTAGAMGRQVTCSVNTGAFFNFSFGINSNGRQTNGYSGSGDGTSPITENNTSTAAPYYLVISNSANKGADLIIALDLTVTQISQSNSVQNPEFVSVNVGDNNTYFGVDNDTVAINNAYNTPMGKRLNIIKSSLGTSSTTTLGANVAAVLVTGTTPYHNSGIGAPTTDNGNYNNNTAAPLSSNYYHELFELTRTVTKTVVAHNPATEELTFDDGTTMKRSWLADTVADNRLLDLGSTVATNSAANVARAHAPTQYGTYTFTVDENNNYIFWSTEGSGSTFIYATYLDYQQPVASSIFTYPMVGVIDGTMVTRNITNGTQPTGTTNGDNMNLSMNSLEYEHSDLPKRDSNGQVGASVRDGIYRGYYISDSGKLSPVLAANNLVSEWKQGDTNYFGANAISINSTSVNIGAVLAGADTTTNTGLYLNNNTVFHIVSGAGTDTQKVETFVGLNGLLGTSSSVTINGHVDVDTATNGSGAWPLIGSTYNYNMIYWTQEAFNYAQDFATTAFAVKEVYIPAEAITRTSATDSTMYFVGDSTPGLWNNTGEKATLFTVYDLNGDAVNLWVEGWARNGDVNADAANTTAATKIEGAGNNFFVHLVDSGKKTNGDQTVYTLRAVSGTANNDSLGIVGRYVQSVEASGTAMILSYANDGTTTDDFQYIASTFSQYIASIGSDRGNLWNVEGAKVVNLKKGTYPGVTDVLTLNAASSLSAPVGANQGIRVSAVRDKDNAQKLSVIFVDA